MVSRWSSSFENLQDGGRSYHPKQAVYTDPVLLDRTEVTNAAWAEYVADAGLGPPLCDCSQPQELPGQYFGEYSGWADDGGLLDSSKLRHPVVCVTRGEAEAFCRSRGGRLPTILEYMKALRGPFPSVQEHPWGATPPTFAAWNQGPQLPANFQSDYLAVSFRDVRGRLNTQEVGTRLLGNGPSGASDLTGNVSEFAAECAEELPTHYGSTTAPLIRPVRPQWRSECLKAPVVVGENWFSVPSSGRTGTGTMTAYAFNYFPNYVSFMTCVDDDRGPLCEGSETFEVFGYAECPSRPPPTDPGNQRRSWSVGFRCAYDVP